jgi:cytochrome c oxidase cbb3-type subunit III
VLALPAAIFVLMHLPGEAAQSTGAAAGVTRAANPGEIKEGASLFRANCSPCHGRNAQGGGRGPDLTTGRWVHGSSDAAIFQTITQGVPSTEMPANDFEDSMVWAMVAYLRSLSPLSKPTVEGDRGNGRQIFFGKGACVQCHMVNGRGGSLGPELTRVGAARSVAYLRESIREASKKLSDGMLDPNNAWANPLVYDTVTAVTRQGQRIVGVAKNEDTFSIQLLDTGQQLHLLLKSDLESLTHERKSLMPDYSKEMLSDAELRDLVAYLQSLRGNP